LKKHLKILLMMLLNGQDGEKVEEGFKPLLRERKE
jgi:hypothetical protein